MATDIGETSGRVEPHHILMQARMRGVPNPPEESYLAYYVSHKSFYAASWLQGQDCEAEIMVSLHAVGGGTFGEFAIRFGHFSDTTIHGNTVRGNPWMRLNVFCDALQSLVQQAELLTALAAICKRGERGESYTPTPDEVEELLKSLGYRDLTRYTSDQPEEE